MKLGICLLRAIIMANNLNILVFVMYTVLVFCEVFGHYSPAPYLEGTGLLPHNSNLDILNRCIRKIAKSIF